MLLSSIRRGFASMADVLRDGASGPYSSPLFPRDRSPPLLLWGPVSSERAKASGAQTPASSVLLKPTMPEQVLLVLRALIPAEVFPQSTDTPKSLAQRLSGCDWLDGVSTPPSALCTARVRMQLTAGCPALADIHVPRRGRAGKISRLNALCLPQPRRVTWSVLVEEGAFEEGREQSPHVKLFGWQQRRM